MQNAIKTALLMVVALLAGTVAYFKFVGDKAPVVKNAPKDGEVRLDGPSPFDGLGLRYDGHYRCEHGGLRYLIRFFPEGRAVLVGGTKDVEATLPDFLIRETKGDPSIGLHNVMPEVRGDSMFFVTKALRGENSYRGRVESASSVHFFRHSHITGADFDLHYLFVSDASRVSGQQPS